MKIVFPGKHSMGLLGEGGGGGVITRKTDNQEKRSSLLDYLKNEYRIKISRRSSNRIFMFLINPPSGNVRTQKLIAKHIFECFEKRKGEDSKVNTQ